MRSESKVSKVEARYEWRTLLKTALLPHSNAVNLEEPRRSKGLWVLVWGFEPPVNTLLRKAFMILILGCELPDSLKTALEPHSSGVNLHKPIYSNGLRGVVLGFESPWGRHIAMSWSTGFFIRF